MRDLSKQRTMHHKIYLTLIGTVFAAGVIVLNTFPRSQFSQLEKRELTHFPQWSMAKLADGSLTKEVSAWFSDSEPFRDELMTMSMKIKDLARLTLSDDNVTFHASDDSQAAPGVEAAEESAELGEFNNHVATDGNAKLANAGIIIVGRGSNVRALMAYGGVGGGTSFANTVNKIHTLLGNGVTVYAMVIPNATEYYIPEKVKNRSKSQLATIKSIHEHLSPEVKAVNIYNTLGNHADEAIYLRTDHHWSPLGGYYAAKEFAKVAGVPFRDLNSYDKHVVHGFVGSMYGYSKDISVKEAPEDFEYYTPHGVEYKTDYIIYEVNDDYKITSASSKRSGPFFHTFKGNGAYSTFMGSDARLTHVKTSTTNGRRLLIIKDSFGNTLPGYLFYSFEEIYVVDNRYFHLNMKKFIKDNQITDLLMAASVFNAYSNVIGSNAMSLLNQNPANAFAPKTEKKAEKEAAATEKDKKDKTQKDSLPKSKHKEAAPAKPKEEKAPAEQPSPTPPAEPSPAGEPPSVQ